MHHRDDMTYVNALIEEGADPDQVNNVGNSPSFYLRAPNGNSVDLKCSFRDAVQKYFQKKYALHI